MPPKQQPVADKEKFPWARFLAASPCLVIAVATTIAFETPSMLQQIIPLAKSPQLTWGNDTIRIKGKITGIKPLDFWLDSNTIIFAPTLFSWDPISQIQSRQLSLDLGILYTVFLIEGARRSNVSTYAGKPNVVAMASQLFTIGIVGPVYFLYHYTFCAQAEKFFIQDERLVDIRHTKFVLPTVLLSFYLPFVMMTGSASSADSQVSWMMAWQFYPLWGAILQYVFATFFLKKTARREPFRDMKTTISLTVALMSVPSALNWWKILLQAEYSLTHLFVPHAAPNDIPIPSNLPNWMLSLAGRFVATESTVVAVPEWMMAIRKIFQVDHLGPFAAAFIWLGLLYSDMFRVGIVTSAGNLVKYFTIGIVSVVIAGPGAAFALGWWYRENLLEAAEHQKVMESMHTNGLTTSLENKKVA